MWVYTYIVYNYHIKFILYHNILYIIIMIFLLYSIYLSYLTNCGLHITIRHLICGLILL